MHSVSKYLTLWAGLLLAIVMGSIPAPLIAQGLSPLEEQIRAMVEQQQSEAVRFLGRTVNINSGTMNLWGVRKVGKLFAKEFKNLGFEVRWIDMPANVNRAGHLFAYRRGSQGKRLLLIGHLDTVFEKDSPFQRFELGDSLAIGPGVADMKGGDVAILYALKALHAHGLLENRTITVVLHGDEESVGHPIEISRRDIIAAAKESDIALGFEGNILGTATVARRGISGWRLEVTGRRGHSSDIFGERYGSGAIFEAARILYSFHEELRGEDYLTFNPGVILGGTDVQYESAISRGTAFGKSNVIAQTVTVEGGLRFISEDQKAQARAKMRTIMEQNLPGTSAEIFFTDSYPGMAPTAGNLALLGQYDQVSRDLGLGPVEPLDPSERGAADISFVAAWVDGLDGLGMVGDGSHTIEEDMDLASLARATELAAILIYRLTSKD
ncbi:MAG: M20/M25/M40 family metallo-hydrolase [Candidatus Neomarinimicrobiota bacterium]